MMATACARFDIARFGAEVIGGSETFDIQFGFANHNREIEKLVRGYRFAKAGF